MWTTNHQTSGKNNSGKGHTNNMSLMKKKKKERERETMIAATSFLCRCFLLVFVLWNRVAHGCKCVQEKKKKVWTLFTCIMLKASHFKHPTRALVSVNISQAHCYYHITSKNHCTSSFVNISQIPASYCQDNKDRAGSYHRYITGQQRQNSTNAITLSLPLLWSH